MGMINFSNWGWFKYCARIMYNMKINSTTRSRTYERSMNLDDLILEMFENIIAEWISWIMNRQRNRSLSLESHSYTVPAFRLISIVLTTQECPEHWSNKGTRVLRKLVSKLLFHLLDRWGSIVHWNKDDGSTARFDQLFDFVKTEAKKVKDSIFCKQALASEHIKFRW